MENFCGCILINNATCRRKPPYSARMALGLTEADGGVVIGVREAWRVLTSSSRTSAGVGSWGSMEVSVPGSVFCHGTRIRHKVKV